MNKSHDTLRLHYCYIILHCTSKYKLIIFKRTHYYSIVLEVKRKIDYVHYRPQTNF